MRGDDQRNTVIELGHNTAKVGIPGMAMNQVRPYPLGIHLPGALHCAKNGMQGLGSRNRSV